MRRIAIVALAAVSVVTAALAMIAAYTASPAGRGALATLAERRIERITGGDVEIGSLSGGLSRRVALDDVRFSADGAQWASIRRVTTEWSPRALLSRRVEISDIVVEDAVLLARPPGRERAEPFKGFELPERLPAVSIERIVLSNLQVTGDLLPAPLRLDGEGSVAMGGAALSIRARVKEARDRDDMEVEIKRGTAAEAPVLKVRIASAPDGAVAALLKSEGAVDVSADGSGTSSEYRITFGAEAGAYGSLSGALSGDIAALDKIAFDLTASPGQRFARLAADLGDTIALSGEIAPQKRGARLTLQRLSGAFGVLSGDLEWRNGERALGQADIALRAKFAPEWRPILQKAVGDQATARISLERQGGEFRGVASAAAPTATATLEELKTDLRSRLSGALSAAISEKSDIAKRARTSLQGAGLLSISAGEGLSLDNVRVAGANGAAFDGDAVLRFEGAAFEIDGKIVAPPSAVKDFIPAISPRGVTSGDVTARGTFERFGMSIAVSAPGFHLGSSAWPASTIIVSLADLPAALTGEFSLQATDGSLRSSARISREPNGVIALSGLDHRGKDFTLTGEAAFNLSMREGDIDLRYSGSEGAEPWPGLSLAGEASAKGSLARNKTDNRIDIRAPSLRTKSLWLKEVTLTATGPADQLSFEATAASGAFQDRARAENLKLAGAVAIAEGIAIKIESASAEVLSEKARLQRPTVISVVDGAAAIDDLALRIGDNGTVDFSGAFTSKRWRADAAIRKLGISANGATIDLDLILDTDKPTAAAGKFSAASGELGAPDGAVRGGYSWDGRRLSVNAGGGESPLSLDLELPLALRRADRLRVSTDGALLGAARFSGRAESIALFLPLTLQSLEGDLAFEGTLSGAVKDPRVQGALSLTDGTYTEAISGLSVVDIDLTSSATATSASSSVAFRGTASGAGQTAKTITADGQLNLRNGVALSANIGLQGARFSAGPVERVDATGTLKVAGNQSELLVSGDVSLSSLQAKLFTPENLGLVDINVVAVGADGQPVPETTAARQRTALRYDVRVEADDNIIVSGRGLNSEWRTSALISGTSNRPLVLGTMNLNRGDLEFSGRRFDLTRGSIGFDTLAPNDPTIDLRAERETRDGASVAVVISGRSSALKVSLESTPTLPSEDVMALILFDKAADELSAFQSLQVADALTQLGGVGVFGGKGFTGAARDALGLDLLNVDVDQTDSSASLLTVGKYVTDGLFVSASQNARGENGSLRIEYEIGQSFSLETELRQDGDQTVSANWKKDF